MIERECFSLPANHGYGKDVSTDREDDLDRACLAEISRLVAARLDGLPVLALDIGGANGIMAVKMAERGAVVTLVDPISQPVHVLKSSSPNIRHARKKIQELTDADILGLDRNKVEVIYGQKIFHYMPYAEALETLRRLCRDYAGKQCKFFLSFSSLDCALGRTGYTGRDYPIISPARHAVPQNEEAVHLGISQPMTLYRKEEVLQLLAEAGLAPEPISESAYGTFKLAASSAIKEETHYMINCRMNSRPAR